MPTTHRFSGRAPVRGLFLQTRGAGPTHPKE